MKRVVSEESQWLGMKPGSLTSYDTLDKLFNLFGP